MKTRLWLLVIFLAITPFLSLAQENIDQLILNRQYEKALQQVNLLLSEQPSAHLFHKKGVILRETFDYMGSISAFNQAFVLDQQNRTYLIDLADMLSSMGNSTDAIAVYRKGLSLGYDDLLLKARMGQLLVNQREFQEAYNILSEIRKTDSTNVFINKLLAIAAARTSKRDEAIVLFESVIEANPRDINNYLNLSGLYNQAELFTRGNNTLRKGLEEFPGNSILLLRLAQNLYAHRNFEEALPVYEEWLTGNQLYFDIRKEYGIVLYFNKKEDKALEILEFALDELPSDPFVALYIGLCHKKLKDFEMSKQYLNLAIESATPYYLSDIYHHLGQVHGMLREFDASIEMLTKSYELDYTNHELLFEIATTYEEYNSNKTLALNYYQLYLTEAREKALNANYALTRIKRIKEDLFFGE
jgi:tetratricopeptide (TPR) repeat protein